MDKPSNVAPVWRRALRAFAKARNISEAGTLKDEPTGPVTFATLHSAPGLKPAEGAVYRGFQARGKGFRLA